MKNILIGLILIIFPFLLHAQLEEPKGVTLGINGGIDADLNAYYLIKSVNGFTYFAMNPQYNIAVDASKSFSKKVRLRIEFKYINEKSGMNLTPDLAVYGTHASILVSYVGSNLHFDYLVYHINKFEIFASPAITYERILSYVISTYNLNVFNDINPPRKIAGGTFSFILKYNITEKIGITLVPEYTRFFREFYLYNGKPYERLSTNLGLEFKF